jgi:hypothetical protein
MVAVDAIHASICHRGQQILRQLTFLSFWHSLSSLGSVRATTLHLILDAKSLFHSFSPMRPVCSAALYLAGVFDDP